MGAEKWKRPPTQVPTDAPEVLPSYLQVGQVSQSQQVHCAHSHTPPLQQSQHSCDAVSGVAEKAVKAKAMSNNAFIRSL